MISVVVNFYNNRREARNTLHSLTRGYQLRSRDIPYEVIALDNGSSQPLVESEVRSFGPEFNYRYFPTDSKSPAQAINQACREAKGENLLIIVDGAHIVSPGVLTMASEAFRMFASPLVATVPLHLGPKHQNLSILEGYCQAAEDELLKGSNWRENGYQLYELAGAFADDCAGWFGCLFESGCFAISRKDFLEIGGLDEKFQSPGGGMVALDFFQNALSRPALEYVMLLGEATFHQIHGGVASNALPEDRPWVKFNEEFAQIRGRRFKRVRRKPFLMGTIPKEAYSLSKLSMLMGLQFWQKYGETAE